jgi:hypothetical protein
MAAPMATTSSGFTERLGSLPRSSFTTRCTAGTRVAPPHQDHLVNLGGG